MKKYLIGMVLSSSVLIGSDIGFKGINLGDDLDSSCKKLSKLFPGSKIKYQKVGDKEKVVLYGDGIIKNNGCSSSKPYFSLKDNKGSNKVYSLYGDYDSFNLGGKTIGEVGQIVVDNISWVNTLEPVQGVYEMKYTHKDEKQNFQIDISSSAISVERIRNEGEKVKKPSF